MMKHIMKGVASIAIMASIGVGSAAAQACEETQFSSTNAENYLKAETELLVNDNPSGALAALNALKAQPLNCYEEGAALRLGAAIKIETGDYEGAVNDLITALNRGFIPASEAKTTYYNVSQIYLSTDNKVKALEYMDKWMDAGGVPDRNQKWTLAVLYQQMDRFNDALPWAEQVLAADGPGADRSVYDFLIFLYDKTGNKAKKAELLELLLARDPSDVRLWQAIAGEYFQAGEDRKAFEVQKAMYLGGLLETEDELMRIVNFYNSFDVPYASAKVLEKEMNAGRISKNYQRLELLANLYQVAREFDRAIPVIEEAARISSDGKMFERLGRSYSELQEWAKAEEALIQAINKGGLADAGLAWVLVGQSRYERDDRSGAREAFRSANNRGGRGWLDFMQAEDNTAVALARFEIFNEVSDYKKEKERCKDLAVIGETTENCQNVDERLAEAEERLAEFDRNT
ncbi:MAG: tetratricopeptide repeat protein [Pseudomonadota bacterium]